MLAADVEIVSFYCLGGCNNGVNVTTCASQSAERTARRDNSITTGLTFKDSFRPFEFRISRFDP
jgi:hypothetical protein